MLSKMENEGPCRIPCLDIAEIVSVPILTISSRTFPSILVLAEFLTLRQEQENPVPSQGLLRGISYRRRNKAQEAFDGEFLLASSKRVPSTEVPKCGQGGC